MDAFQALHLGMIQAAIPRGQLREETLKLAWRLASYSPAALRAAKCALRGGDESACFAGVWGEADWREGIDALLNKRVPVFESDLSR